MSSLGDNCMHAIKISYRGGRGQYAHSRHHLTSNQHLTALLDSYNLLQGTGQLPSVYWLGLTFNNDTMMWFFEDGCELP